MRYNRFQKEEAKNFKCARHSVFDRLHVHPHLIRVSITRIDHFGFCFFLKKKNKNNWFIKHKRFKIDFREILILCLWEREKTMSYFIDLSISCLVLCYEYVFLKN